MQTFPHPRRARASAALALALGLAACATRSHREPVFQQDRVEVALRWQTRSGEPVPRDYNHPAIIAAVRVGHILSRLDVRSGGDEPERRPAIHTDLLFPVAEGVSQALARATPAQEVVVLAIRRTKRLGLFDRNYLTSFVAYVKGEQLYVHLSRTDWEIPRKRMDRLPQPRAGEHPMKFRMMPGRAIAAVDSQSVAVDWRHSIFKRPTRTLTRPGGEVVRRTILMEMPEEPDAPGEDPPAPGELSPTALRRLADLEELRRGGLITEAQYEARRREILRSEAE